MDNSLIYFGFSKLDSIETSSFQTVSTFMPEIIDDIIKDIEKGLKQFNKLSLQVHVDTKEVDGKTKTIISEEGTKLKYDYLITIPPHKGAQVVEDSIEGAKGGWCPTDKKKLYLEGKTDVFICGDTTNIPISKAGSTAHFEADTIIDNISSLIQI